MVGLPSTLVKWSRHHEAEPFRWTEGDYVKVGLTPGGKFVIEYIPFQELRGHLIDDSDGVSDQFAPPLLTPAFRKSVRIRRWGDSGVESEKWVKPSMGMNKPDNSWAAEVKKWRAITGWRQNYAAMMIGVTPVTYNRWERGKSKPSSVQRDILAERMKLLKREASHSTDGRKNRTKHRYMEP